MATVTVPLYAGAATLPTAAGTFPGKQPITVTNFTYDALVFSATAVNSCYWLLDVSKYGSGNITLDVWWLTSGTTGNARWEGSVFSHAAGAGASFESKNFATATAVNGAAAGTSLDLIKTTITITNLDSVSSSKICFVKLARIGNDGTNDSLTTVANVIHCQASFSDT